MLAHMVSLLDQDLRGPDSPQLRGGWRLLALVGLLVTVAACDSHAKEQSSTSARGLEGTFDAGFWRHWGDGMAEMAAYDLRFPRYGETRDGVAVTVFVTEDFSLRDSVKAAPRAKKEEIYPVMKLNMVRDFPTGVYDYNTMTSAFVPLVSKGGVEAGRLVKVSFGSQEWCGQVYHQLNFQPDNIRSTRHSYFAGEADAQELLERPTGGVSEDRLFHWARGFAAPLLGPGEQVDVPFLPSLLRTRLSHKVHRWTRARMSRRAKPEQVKVPGGEFSTHVYEIAVDGGYRATFHVEVAAPNRLVRWSSSEGEVAVMLGSERMKYWELNNNGGEAFLSKFGLLPRATRTP